MGSTVDGLISGMDTTTIISQLMKLEASSQTKLKTKATAEGTVVKAYQAVSTRVAAMKAAAVAVNTDDNWQKLQVSSSSPSVTVSATSSPINSSINFDVTSLAAAHSLRSDVVTGTTATMSTGAGLDFTINGGTPIHVDTTDTSLAGVVGAINAKAGLGITAAAVQVADGTYRLQLNSKASGVTGEFTVTGLTQPTGVARQASDASISVGTGPGAYTVTSHSNTFTGVLPGVTFTVSKEELGVSLTSGSDSEGIAAKVQAMVDAANASITEVTTNSSYDATNKVGGPLLGDQTVRQIASKITSSVGESASGGISLNAYGIETDRSGKLTFNKNKFLEAYATDPAQAKNMIGTVFAKKLDDIAEAATNFTTGTITTAINTGNEEIKNLNDRVADWDVRLALRKTTLERQYAAMETALGKLKNQSTWLSGQLAGLSANNG